MPNRTKSFLMAAALLALPSFASADSTASVQTVPPVANVGDTVVVNVNIADVADLYAFGFDLVFDPSVLAAQSVTEGAFLPSSGATFFLPGFIDNVGGSVTFNADSLIGTIPGFSGSGTLVTFDFLAIGSGISILGLENTTFLDSNLSNLPVTLQGGSASVSGVPVSTPEPSTALLLVVSLLAVLFLASTVGNHRCFS
jgi:Cohesin domain